MTQLAGDGVEPGASTSEHRQSPSWGGSRHPHPSPTLAQHSLPAGQGPDPSTRLASSLSKEQLRGNKKGGLKGPSSVDPANLPLLRTIPSSGTLQRQEEEAPAGSCWVGGADEASRSARPPLTDGPLLSQCLPPSTNLLELTTSRKPPSVSPKVH